MALPRSKIHELADVMACDDEAPRYDEFVAWLKEEFASLDHQRRMYVIAEERGLAVGFVRLWHSPHIEEWIIDGIVVTPSHRRRGVGAGLLSRALHLAQQSGAASVVAHARADRVAAIALYEKAGFERETTTYLNSYGEPRSGTGWQLRLEFRDAATRSGPTAGRGDGHVALRT